MNRAAITVVAAAWLGGGLAMAAERPAAANGPTAVDRITGCRSIADSTARLACYDAGVDQLTAAQQGGGLVVLDREQVHAARRSLFGFNVPKLPFLEDKDKGTAKGSRKSEPVESEINATIRAVRQVGVNAWALVLDDGANWETTEAPQMDPRPGDPIRIKRAALGSYLANIHGQRAVRIRRIG